MNDYGAKRASYKEAVVQAKEGGARASPARVDSGLAMKANSAGRTRSAIVDGATTGNGEAGSKAIEWDAIAHSAQGMLTGDGLSGLAGPPSSALWQMKKLAAVTLAGFTASAML